MVPQGVFPVPHLCHIVLLPKEAVPEECQHLPYTHHLCHHLLHIVLEQDVPHLEGQGTEMLSDDGHVQLGIAVYVVAGGDLPFDVGVAYVLVTGPRWEQVFKSGVTCC